MSRHNSNKNFEISAINEWITHDSTVDDPDCHKPPVYLLVLDIFWLEDGTFKVVSDQLAPDLLSDFQE